MSLQAAPAAQPGSTDSPNVSCRFPFPPLVTSGAKVSASSPEYLCVEYPGFVERIEKAIEKVKGEENIRKVGESGQDRTGAEGGSDDIMSTAVLQSSHISLFLFCCLPLPCQLLLSPDALLKLFYRPADGNSHPLYGEVHRDLLTKPQPPTAATTQRKQQDSHADRATTVEQSFDFLMRVVRKRRRRVRNTTTGGEEEKASTAAPRAEEVSAQFLGQISTSVTFPGLCDFQLLHPVAPEIELDLPQLWPAASTVSGGAGAGSASFTRECFLPNRAGECVLAPLLFSRYDYAREYHFAIHDNAVAAVRAAAVNQTTLASRIGGAESDDDEKAGGVGSARRSSAKRARETPSQLEEVDEEDEEDDLEDAGEDASEARSIKRGRKTRRYFITYDAANESPEGPEPGSIFAQPIYQQRDVVHQLRGYFAERAIWSTDALVIRLDEDHRKRTAPSSMPQMSRQEILHHLVAVAYRFSGGPWRNLWIRYNYDPRKRANADEARMSVQGMCGLGLSFATPHAMRRHILVIFAHLSPLVRCRRPRCPGTN